MKLFCFAFLVLAWSLGVLAQDKKAKPVDWSKLPLPVPRKVDFAREVYPLLKESCFGCHGEKKQKGKYRCDTREGAFKDTDYGPTIVPGRSEQSALIHMVCGLVDELLMPPPSDQPGESEQLTKEQIGLLRAWIDQGAVWPAGPIADVVPPVTFAADLQPVFAVACAACHAGVGAKGGFDIGSREAVLRGGKTYGRAVTPGDLKQSPLITIVSGLDEDLPLPEKHKLPPKPLALVKKWVGQGAK